SQLGIGVIGMKALKGIERAAGKIPDPEPYLRYALSLPISTLTIGLRQGREVEQNLEIVKAFRKMSAAEMRTLEVQSKPLADVGHLWWKRR
ncbi:MAG TPA: hypothetical protein VM328_10300, partial [Fimbriimonadaceae bacterium]|nr:hypothetical protein [Fimbriimonadaceae bacterium]